MRIICPVSCVCLESKYDCLGHEYLYLYIYIYICMCTCQYVYIYIYYTSGRQTHLFHFALFFCHTEPFDQINTFCTLKCHGQQLIHFGHVQNICTGVYIYEYMYAYIHVQVCVSVCVCVHRHRKNQHRVHQYTSQYAHIHICVVMFMRIVTHWLVHAVSSRASTIWMPFPLTNTHCINLHHSVHIYIYVL